MVEATIVSFKNNRAQVELAVDGVRYIVETPLKKSEPTLQQLYRQTVHALKLFGARLYLLRKSQGKA